MDKTTVKKSGTSSWNVSKIKSGNKHFVRKNVHGTTSRRPVATSSWNVSADFKRVISIFVIPLKTLQCNLVVLY